MDAAKYWLLQTPAEILKTFSETGQHRPVPPSGKELHYAALTIRIFTFHEEEVLLTRSRNAPLGHDEWTVPTHTSMATAADHATISVRDRVLRTYKSMDLPTNSLWALQFAEFGKCRFEHMWFPLDTTRERIDLELQIFVILTVDQINTRRAPPDSLPEVQPFRCVACSDVPAVRTPFARTQFGRELMPLDITNAFVSRANLLSEQPFHDDMHSICTNALLAVIEARHVAEGTPNPGFGYIVMNTNDVSQGLRLLPCSPGEAANWQNRIVGLGHQIIGRWAVRDLKWKEDADVAWEAIITNNGRLNVSWPDVPKEPNVHARRDSRNLTWLEPQMTYVEDWK